MSHNSRITYLDALGTWRGRHFLQLSSYDKLIHFFGLRGARVVLEVVEC